MSPFGPQIVITGSSGFIGTHLVRRFRELGWNVQGIGRRPSDEPGYLSHDLSRPLPKAWIESLGDGPDVLVHAAARSNPWGTRAEFEQDNVVATQNVIDVCLGRRRPPKLVYISSSSVCYREEHQLGVTEEMPLPDRAVNLYAETKRRAEELVRGYPGPWAILRPRAVFGPGDTVLLPRILRAAREGRLPILYAPDGPVVGDLIYIDNLVDTVVAAASPKTTSGSGESAVDAPTGVFYLTNDEPVPIHDFLFGVFDRLGIPRPTRRVSARTAMVVAGGLELFHRLFRPKVEPAITRFGVHVFRYSKTFDIAKAKRVLGPPRVSLDEGLERTVEWFRRYPDGVGPL